MEFITKAHLCQALQEFITVDNRLSVPMLIGNAKSLNEAGKNVSDNIKQYIKLVENKKIQFALKDIVYKYDMGKDYHFEYERLMRWIVKDYQGYDSEERRNASLQTLIMNVGAMDMFCVIRDNDDFIHFKQDLESRVNRKFI